jgi:predicted unusual protein kinase regulating ubiquinone biosynthesis (AarF/ABC1/UbiB family)
MFNADPHPGNYLFRENGEVTFLDFGCVQPLTPTHLSWARTLHRCAIDRDEAKFRDSARGLLGTTPGPYEDWALAFSRDCFEPLFGSPFKLTRDYTAKLTTAMQTMKNELMFNKKANITPLPPGMLFMNRLQFGFYSVLARLDVSVDYAAIEDELLKRVETK